MRPRVKPTKANPDRPRSTGRIVRGRDGRVMLDDLSRHTPDWVIEQTVRADRYREAGDLYRAARIYEKILDRKVKKPWRMLTAIYNYGALLHQQCQHDKAIYCFRQVLQYAPDLLEAWYNLGTALQETLRCEEAIECFRRALAVEPNHTGSLINLGNALMGAGFHTEAGEAYERAVALKADAWDALYNQSHYLILSGRWTEGWWKYEARWSIPGFRALNTVSVDSSRTDAPRPWQGEPLQGKRLIVCEEQGWGDTLMCLRYAPALRALGASVTWAVREEMVRLAAKSVYPDRVVSIEEELPGGDYCVTTMSLHQRLKITTANVPGADGYLRAA